MILVTGWSGKLDGIAFLADTDDEAEACQMCCADWNERFSDQCRLAVGENTVLVLAGCDVPDEELTSDDYEVRREGFVLVCTPISVGVVTESMPW